MIKNIAVAGATSHIAKGLISNFLKKKQYRLFLFARSPRKVKDFLAENNLNPQGSIICGFRDFGRYKYDVIINCVGLGTPAKVSEAKGEVFKLTEKFDNIILRRLCKYPGTRYINFSSGAVYGISAGQIKPEHYYGIAKLHQEANHRFLRQLNIVDIRVFSYFSRFIDKKSGYFITDLLGALRKKAIFVTDSCDFVRDFIAPQDLFNLICLIIKAKPFNGYLDAYSLKPVRKSEILKFFVKNYSLQFVIKKELNLICPTGKKIRYCPTTKSASRLGYLPKFSSMDVIRDESRYLLGVSHG